jgi:hypothetical protein
VPDPEFAAPLREGLTAGLTRLGEGFERRWEPCAKDTFEVVATPPPGTGPNARWLVDLGAGTIAALDSAHPGSAHPDSARPDAGEDSGDEEPDSSWDVIASADTWDQVIAGKLNMSVALRRHLFRYRDSGEAGPIVADARIAMLADLLGLTSWGQARQRGGQASRGDEQA